jgi:hypothetical protein
MAQIQTTYPSNQFEIDWSRAPRTAKWWAIDESGEAHWFCSPDFIPLAPFWYVEQVPAPDFAFDGDWRESLSEKP